MLIEAHEFSCGCAICRPPTLTLGKRTEFYDIRVESEFFKGKRFRIPRKSGMEPPEEIGVPDHGSLLYHRHIATAPDGTLVYG